MKRVLCLIDGLGSGGAQKQLVGLATFQGNKKYNMSFRILYLIRRVVPCHFCSNVGDNADFVKEKKVICYIYLYNYKSI